MFFSIEDGNDYVRFPEPDSSHREVDQKISMHAVCVGREKMMQFVLLPMIQKSI